MLAPSGLERNKVLRHCQRLHQLSAAQHWAAWQYFKKSQLPSVDSHQEPGGCLSPQHHTRHRRWLEPLLHLRFLKLYRMTGTTLSIKKGTGKAPVRTLAASGLQEISL